MEPEVMMQSGFLRLAKGVICAPELPTCNGHCIDYFIVSESFRSAVEGTRRLEDTPFHPHSPVRLLLKANAREDKVRRIVRPKLIGSVLPSGCLRNPRVMAEWGNDEEYDPGYGNEGRDGGIKSCSTSCSEVLHENDAEVEANKKRRTVRKKRRLESDVKETDRNDEHLDKRFTRWLRCAERVWYDLKGHEAEKRGGDSKAISRCEGVQYRWSCALGKVGKDVAVASRLLIEYRAIAGHLRTIVRAQALRVATDKQVATMAKEVSKAKARMWGFAWNPRGPKPLKLFGSYSLSGRPTGMKKRPLSVAERVRLHRQRHPCSSGAPRASILKQPSRRR